MTKTALLFVFAALCLAPRAGAAGYDAFKTADEAALKPFARDIGALLGSGSNQTARPLGFSGFDIGVRAAAQFNPARGDTVLKKNNTFGLGLVQAEIGMPYRVDGFVRGGVYEGLAVAGGGLRYGLWNVSDEKNKINAMITGMADMAVHRYFSALHFSTSLVCSMNVPVVAPYVGVGFDFTRLEAQVNDDPSIAGKKVSVSEPRFTAGVRAKINLGYLGCGVTYTNERMLAGASAGFRF